MNIRKTVDYSQMYAGLDEIIAKGLPQMELYISIGHIVSSRSEKGAAVIAAEYLQKQYPELTGFSPRNLRRMRELYRTYEERPDLMKLAEALTWTQNVVIIEAELSTEEREWYLNATAKFGWSKSELTAKISSNAYLEERQCDNESIVIEKSLENEKPVNRKISYTMVFRSAVLCKNRHPRLPPEPFIQLPFR